MVEAITKNAKHTAVIFFKIPLIIITKIGINF